MAPIGPSPAYLCRSRAASINPSALRLTDSYKVYETVTPKVLVLFCGGTLIMRENQDGSLVVNDKDKAIELLLNMEPRMSEIAQLDVHYIDNIDSSNMSPERWDEIGRVIYDHYDDYVGFVITHGTDTMAFTASALSFVLGDLGKPVTITGAHIPGGRIETDARRNFVNAVKVATLSKAGVMLIFDGDVILGARSHKLSESKLDAFGPINWTLLGEIRIDVHFSQDAKERHDRPLRFRPGFETDIAVFTLFPGFPPRDIENAIKWGTKGIILRGYGSGNISYMYMDAVKLAQTKKIPIVVNTQCLEGATLMHMYDVGKQALDHGVIQAYDMSTECIITKLMWALKHADSYEQIRGIMHTNYTGELNKEGRLYKHRKNEPCNFGICSPFLVFVFFHDRSKFRPTRHPQHTSNIGKRATTVGFRVVA
jgi:L-asparaginase